MPGSGQHAALPKSVFPKISTQIRRKRKIKDISMDNTDFNGQAGLAE
jgi:hypothetical protein